MFDNTRKQGRKRATPENNDSVVSADQERTADHAISLAERNDDTCDDSVPQPEEVEIIPQSEDVVSAAGVGKKKNIENKRQRRRGSVIQWSFEKENMLLELYRQQLQNSGRKRA